VNSNDLKKLCICIAKEENGNEVVNILKRSNLWDNEE